MDYQKFNFYKNKNYKYLVIIPILMFLIGIYFIPHIALDSSLRGGIEIQIQTNSIINIQTLTSAINYKIPEAEASVSPATGGYDINIAANSSISNAYSQLLSLYSDYTNYSKESTMIAVYQNIKPQNSTIVSALNSESANQTKTLQAMQSDASLILITLKPLLNKSYSFNPTNPQQIVNVTKSAYADAESNYKAHILNVLSTIVPYSSYTYQETTATLGSYFLNQLEYIIISSFIIVAIVAFIIFRSPAPSVSVVFGAVNDLVVALAGMAILGIPLGIASIGGLLMLIGYSMDTDVLAAIRILKRTDGLPEDRAFSTMKTGLTMTFAAIITFLILFITAYLSFIPTYFEISSVVLIGLFGDIITTWLGDTVFVLWYKEHKDSKIK